MCDSKITCNDKDSKIKFNDEELTELRQQHGLTEAQVCWLQRELGVISDLAGPGVPMQDVRAELVALAKHLAHARSLVQKWEKASSPSAGAEALGHVGMASTGLLGSRPDEPNDRPAVASAIEALAAVADRAVAMAPSKRRARAASPAAIERIYEQLCRPTDDESKQAAQALTPSRYDGKKGPRFVRVAQLVFKAIERAAHKATGSIVKPLDAENSIRQYLAAKKR